MVVIFDPQDEETLRRVRDQWQSGNPHPLLEAVETFDERFSTRPQFFTLVGNHSSQAHVRRWQEDRTAVMKRPTFVFFKD